MKMNQPYDAFLRAITYKPNMGWNDMYAPDAKDTFDAARKALPI